jgi:hypothetical protein
MESPRSQHQSLESENTVASNAQRSGDTDLLDLPLKDLKELHDKEPCRRVVEWSTITAETRKMTKHTCKLCGLVFTGGPSKIRTHQDPAIRPRILKACIPVLGTAAATQQKYTLKALREIAAAEQAAADAKSANAKSKASPLHPRLSESF